MNPSSFLPIGSMAAGLLGLWVDPKENQAKKWTIAASIVLVGLLTMWAAHYDQTRAKERQDKATQEAALAKAERKADHDLLVLISESVAKQSGYTPSKAASATPQQAIESAKASTTAYALIASLPTANNGLAIEFFKHLREEVDPQIVIARLRQVTPTIREMPATPGMQNTPTNVIWVGNQVTDKEARAVASILVAAGVNIRDIRSLRDDTGAKSRLIEIGASRRVVELPIMTAADIAGAQVRKPTDPQY